MNTIAFTCGDINGIGPEITIKALNKISAKNNKSKIHSHHSRKYISKRHLD